ncbi:PxKF domain-containing protein [Nocardioides jiangxiensis]|uniref:PxKF domain-containing protein n=1 Tax=Nocardioides jiangxiensis TaxID=3064524 RepID=A0ABT9B2K1_9ACTN|nr:PxKF domain-containing protein [Nocardioides sp. WY-20]MDO7869074.1 PxKF domain-containing protein [Nocardioides sp. WY-20]
MRPSSLPASLVATGALVLLAPSAFADNLVVTDELHASTGSLDLGAVCLGEAASDAVAFTLRHNGSDAAQVWADSTLVSITTAGASAGGASVSATPSSATTPAGWSTSAPNSATYADASTVTVTVPAGAATGAHGATLTFTASGTGASRATVSRTDTLDVSWTAVDCTPVVTNRAPVVAAQAADANGNEGDTLATTGGFTDPDGDPLVLTQTAGAGVITDHGDGTFSWSLATVDNGGGTVTVQASDGVLTATQSFSWSAANVAPGVGPLTATYVDACTAAVSAPFTDPGTADTHTASISWGDGATTGVDPATSPVTGSHTFGAGTFTVGVSVTDDDGGTGSASLTGGFATKNTPSALLQPINATGTRSTFKLGSTVPVKITVKDCSNATVSTLAPTVSLTRLDTQADGTVNEIAADSVATNGLQMRWDAAAQQYVYNLSTKLSQQTGAALTAGTYRITVIDPSFFGSTSAVVDLRK